VKNVVLITIDCLRFDALSKEYTPFMWNLRKEGLFFTKTYSLGSWTSPSIVGLLTSTYPLMYDGQLSIKYPRISIAEVLKSNGYSTLGFTFHPYLGRQYGFNRGFDVYYDSPILKNRQWDSSINAKTRFFATIRNALKKILKSRITPKNVQNYIWFKLLHKRIATGSLPYVPGFEINFQVKQHLENISEPFFLWIHYLDTHFPYVPRDSDISPDKIAKLNIEREKWFKLGRRVDQDKLKKLKELYLLTARDVDSYVRDIVEYFKEKGLYKNTIFILTADHGEEFYEHGGFHHEIKLYEELIHVPMIMFGGRIKSKEISATVSHIDVFPTVMDFIGISKPPEWIGKNMLLRNSHTATSEEGQRYHGSAFKGRTVKLDINFAKVAIVQGDWKYIHGIKTEELYNLNENPKEFQNLAKVQGYKDVLNMLRQMYIRHMETVKSYTPERFIISKVSRRLSHGKD